MPAALRLYECSRLSGCTGMDRDSQAKAPRWQPRGHWHSVVPALAPGRRGVSFV